MEKQMIVSGLCDVITALLPAPGARLLKILRGNSRQITVKLSWNNKSEGKNAGEFPHAHTCAHTPHTLFWTHVPGPCLFQDLGHGEITDTDEADVLKFFFQLEKTLQNEIYQVSRYKNTTQAPWRCREASL